MRTSLLALLFTFGSLALHGQAPDCQFTHTFTSAGYAPDFNNRTLAAATPCVKWRVAYYADGLSVVSIALEGANDTNGSAGIYAAIPSANVYEGTNPLTDANQATAAMTAYYPWITLHVSTFTPDLGAPPHQIVARVYGYKGTSPGSASTGGGIVACSTTPPTTGTAGETCYTTTNLVYLCPGSGPCSVLGDWTLIGPGSGFVNPMNALGDTIYGGAAGAPQALPGNTTTAQKFLSQTGDGSNSAAPSWQPAQSSGTLTYYLQSTDSALTNPSAIVTTDKQMLTPPQGSKTNIDIAHNASGDVILQSFATDPGFPGITFIPFGVYIWHIHAERLSGNRAVTLYAVFREVTAIGTNVGTIGTQTESSLALNGVEQEFPLAMADGNPYFLALATSRIVIDCHAVFTGGSTNTTVRMFVGGTADSHISLPSNTVDSTSFVPYSGATADVALGVHAITGAPFTGDSGSGGTTGLVPAPAAGDAAAGKYLSAGGGYSVPPSGAGSTVFSSTTTAGPNDSAAETSVIGTVTGSKTIAANTFTNGAVLQARAQGFFSLPAVADSLTLKMKCGSTVIGSASFTPGAGVLTNGSWRFWLDIAARGTGAGGAFITNGLVELTGSLLTDTTAQVLNTTTVAFDFTTACVFDVTADWGAAQAGETFKGTNVAAWFAGIGSGGGGGGGGGIVPNSATGAATIATLDQTNWSIVNGALYDEFLSNFIGVQIANSGSTDIRCISKPLSDYIGLAQTYTIYASLFSTTAVTDTILSGGFFLYDGTQLEGFVLDTRNSHQGYLTIYTVTSVSGNFNSLFGGNALVTPNLYSLKIVEDGTHRTWYYRAAAGWTQALQEPTNTFLTPDRICVGGMVQSGSVANFGYTELRYLNITTP